MTTAPRDGTRVITYCQGTDTVAVCQFSRREGRFPWISNLLGTKGHGCRVFADDYFDLWTPLP
jgi:hypothetical protein